MDLPDFLIKAGGVGPQAARAKQLRDIRAAEGGPDLCLPPRQCVPIQTDKWKLIQEKLNFGSESDPGTA